MYLEEQAHGIQVAKRGKIQLGGHDQCGGGGDDNNGDQYGVGDYDMTIIMIMRSNALVKRGIHCDYIVMEMLNLLRKKVHRVSSGGGEAVGPVL